MHRWNSLDEVPPAEAGTVAALGNFDGVHRGHRAVLATVVAAARRRGARAVAVTFDPHPLAVLHPERAPELLCGLQERLHRMAEAGLDGVLVMDFTRELASWTPERFVRTVFVETLGVVEVVVGRDVRFGRGNAGDLGTLQELGRSCGFAVTALDDVSPEPADGGDGVRPWSSTRVRRDLGAGAVDHAAAVLGRPHRVVGTVVHGDHRGRELGYPTANLSAEAEGVVPADGVYAGWLVRLDAEGPDARLPAAVSVGTNPTFDGVQRRVEAYALDRTGLDLYGERVAVEFTHRLRPTLRFDGVEALVAQMARDVEQCRRLLA
ncbi:riboflavin kinase/FMN adenylyltransferase [Kineococcus xinjiangensis]|uniref:Riboflavin biosynthesis protein n=1 Tax=Kineococcus xinjiangensis TaxID=512762 RepID=A0A2S6IW75_9ACTN|nr:bifunctional riboflavin kinase/FAD synthetase [Kineococcus xinjiangensis]PPK98490.1 riboflavin kinase/FMN adenylyltransferase [Kineococcus xinjiangensis]